MEQPAVTAVRQRLNAVPRRQWADLIHRAGVSRSWLYMFARGDIPNPTINSLVAVERAIADMAAAE